MTNLLLIKLGGSVVTDKTKEFTANEANITRFAGELKSALKSYRGKIILGHGGGSFPHTPAVKYRTKQGLVHKDSAFGMCVVEDAARQLNNIIVNKFIKQKIPVFPFSPASFLISDAQVYLKSYIDPINKALEMGIVPVVYGDPVFDKKQACTIFSTEKVLSVFAQELHKKYKIRMIYVSNVDGVYDMNKKTLPVISRENFKDLKASFTGSGGIDVTGGMLHKVEEALNMAKKYKIETLIINGNIKGNLQKAIEGQIVVGTKIN